MATLPATAAGEVRRILRVPNGDGTDSPAKGYAYLYPNLRPGTPYRASSVEPQLASKTRLVFDGAGQLEDPETGLWAKVLGSDAPGATFPDMQWVLEYHLENVPPTEQPARQFFTVPAGSFVNVDLIADTGPQPNTQTVYIDAAPTVAAVTTTDTAVNNLLSSATATRTSLDARYALDGEASAAQSTADAAQADVNSWQTRAAHAEAAGTFAINALSGGGLQSNIAINFPASRFSVAPIFLVGSGSTLHNVGVVSVSATQAVVTVYNHTANPSSADTGRWHAIQMTSSTAAG